MTESDLLACRQCLKARNIQKMTLFIIYYFQVHMVKKKIVEHFMTFFVKTMWKHESFYTIFIKFTTSL